MKRQFGISKVLDKRIKISRPSPAANVSGSDSSGRNALEKFASEGFGKEFKLAHLVGAENASFALAGELLKKLPAESSFAGSGSGSDDVETGAEELMLVEVPEAGAAVSVIFQVVNFGFKIKSEEIRERGFRGRSKVAGDLVEASLSFGNDVGRREYSFVGVLMNDIGGKDKFSQVGFLLDDVGMIFGASGGISSVDERKQIGMVDFLEVAEFTKFFLNGEIIDRHAFGIEAEDSLENESVFDAEKVIRLYNGDDLGDNAAIMQEHSREELFLHFNGFRKISHDKSPREGEQKKKRHSRKVNVVLKIQTMKVLARKAASLYNISVS